MGIFDVLVAIVLGIVEGITEWLPISSTGHMILVNQFLTFSNDDFTQMFLVVVQLGAIMAVVLLFWKKIFPFNFQYKQNSKPFVKMDIMTLWFKILVATIPAAIVGVLFDDVIDEMFYNQIVVAGALIIYGILFIIADGLLSRKFMILHTRRRSLSVFSSFWQRSFREHPVPVQRSSEH